MTDYRDRSTFRSHSDDHSDDPAQRWRQSEARYRREASGSQGDNRFDDDRYEANRRNREFGYGRTSRDDPSGGSAYGQNEGREQRGYGQRTYYAARDYSGRDDNQPVHHWHEQDRDLRSGQPYQGTYGGTGDSSYFTAQQGSWAVGGPQTSHNYYGGGAPRYGADYRQHGYGRDDDNRRGFWDRATDEVASWFGDDDAARRREQDHRGRGPQDYTRSDERIREDANDRLTDDWRVDASSVTVTVQNAEVTLNGTVSSREAKRRAEDVVDSISGVKHVQNNLRVQDARSGDWSQNRTSSTTDAKQNNKV